MGSFGEVEGGRASEGGEEREEIKGIISKDISNLSPFLESDSAWPGAEGL